MIRLPAWHWPRTLFARLGLILCIGLASAQALSFWLTMTERDDATRDVMMDNIERDVANSVALLDHLPADQRAQWLPKLARRNYQFALGTGIPGTPPGARLSKSVEDAVKAGIGQQYALTVNAVPGGNRERLQVHLKLSDGMPITIDMRPMSSLPLSPWLPVVLLLQLAVLGLCCWLAVRVATRPLAQLASAADTLGPALKADRLHEGGPSEVARAARAFNAMQERIQTYMTERMQILSSISHDLQTPITRMRLRLDVMDDMPETAKLQQDLHEMEALVKEGVTYARTMHDTLEKSSRVDPDALLDSMVCDYVDAGQQVACHGTLGESIVTRPQSLRRLLSNLIDNAIKYAGAAEVEVAREPSGRIAIAVLDRGPGIPQDSLEAVFEPFVRLEKSRNRETGGTGLGLAIARQLAQALDATLTLRNRDGGGLEARVVFDSLR